MGERGSVSDMMLVFASQFVYVMLLGLQSLNVNGRHYALAATTSSMLGVLGFWITATIAQKPHVGTAIWWAYLAAGPAGICASIYLHPKVAGIYARLVGGKG